MQVFVDSNQFISDFLLEGAPFHYLLHFLSNSGHTLLLPRLVIEEVENKYEAEARKALADDAKSRQRLKQLGLSRDAATEAAPSVLPLDIQARIRKFGVDIEVIEYVGVAHADVVQRALKRRKPFDAEGDVGYRDCLLWLSLLQHLAHGPSSNSENVIFISSNWRDFYETSPDKQSKAARDGKVASVALSRQLEAIQSARSADRSPEPRSRVQFHSDLTHDLKSLKQQVLPFDSLAAFVDSKVDKHKHAINHEKKFELFEDFLEASGLEVLKRLDESNGPAVLQHVFSLPTASALTILSSEAETLEGVEDFDIYVAEKVGRNVYIGCGYDLRIVNVTLFVPRIQFDAHRLEIESAPHVWEITPLGDSVAIGLSLRAYYQANFSFDPRTEECTGFYLDSFAVR
jgi:hypothetical protein